MFDIVTATPSAAVASAGTIEFAYPAGKSAGHYATFGHKAQLHGLMNSLSQDAGDFSLAFTTVITMTYNGSTSIPAGSLVSVQVNMRGQDDGGQYEAPLMKRMYAAPTYRIDLGTPKAIDTDAIAESQSVSAAASFTLNGVQSDLYGGVNVKLDVPRALTASWTTASILTITGKDEYGDIIVEKSASGTSHTGKKAFAEITSISSSASITSAIVGIGDVLGLPVYIGSVHQIVGELVDNVLIARKPGKVYMQGTYLEATVDAGTSVELVSPVAGRINKLTTIVGTGNGITTGGAITVEVNTVAVDGLSVVVADAATNGDVDSDVPTAGHATAVVAVGDRIEIIAGSAFNASADLDFILEIDVDGASLLDGTFVAGVQTLPTATTGDVKGTYDPSALCDASKSFSLIAILPDPSYKGVDNYDG
jgi:hypothetical protein